MKRTTGKTVQTLNSTKRKLNDLLTESKRLSTAIRERKKATDRLTKDLNTVEAEVAKEKARNRKFKIQQSNPDMPQVLDYVTQKSQMYDLQAAVRNWDRKIEIVGMAARRARTTIREINAKGFAVDEAGNLSRIDLASQDFKSPGGTRRMNNNNSANFGGSFGATTKLPRIPSAH